MAATDTAAASVTLTFNNNSGIDLVVAMVQGLIKGQSITEAAWLMRNSVGDSSWAVPSNLSPKSDLLGLVTILAKDASLVIEIPEYAVTVGFRCLIAEPAYRQHAVQSYKGTYYLAFPDLLTATYVFDKFEAGLTTGIPGIWNITAVDFFALAMQLSANNVTVGYKKGVTSTGLWKKLGALPAPYSTVAR